MTKIYYLHQGDNIPFYVGKTNLSLNKRLNTHKRKFNNVFIELIEEVNIQEWKTWECFWIEQFRQWGFKLKNKNKGGGGSTKWTLEQKENKNRREKLSKSLKGKNLGKKPRLGKKQSLISKTKMSMAHKGVPLSQEHKQSISKAMGGHSKNNEWRKNLSIAGMNRKHTEEEKQKISQSHKGKKKSAEHIAKIQATLKTMQMPKRSEQTKALQSLNNGKSKKVNQYDLQGNFINQFRSGSQASRELGISVMSISSCALGKIKTGGGFVWKYENC